jgi:hypothetical protein
LFAVLVYLSSHAELGREYPLKRGVFQMDRRMASSAVFSSVCAGLKLCAP